MTVTVNDDNNKDGDDDDDDDDDVYVTTCPTRHYTPMADTARRSSSKLTVFQYYRTAREGCTGETVTANTNMKIIMSQYYRENARHHEQNGTYTQKYNITQRCNNSALQTKKIVCITRVSPEMSSYSSGVCAGDMTTWRSGPVCKTSRCDYDNGQTMAEKPCTFNDDGAVDAMSTPLHDENTIHSSVL